MRIDSYEDFSAPGFEFRVWWDRKWRRFKKGNQKWRPVAPTESKYANRNRQIAALTPKHSSEKSTPKSATKLAPKLPFSLPCSSSVSL